MQIFKTFLLIITVTLCSCDKPDINSIVGKYKIDKFRIINASVKEDDNYNLLIIKTEQNFELISDRINIKGKWCADKLSLKRDYAGGTELSGKITFLFGKESTEAELKGTIIEFLNPNDIYLSKYKSLLYVKTKL